MIVHTEFELNGVGHKLELDTVNLDRNYDDEAYGYWIVPLEGESFLEVNILKELVNGMWSWSLRGYAVYYKSTEQTGPTETVQIGFEL